MYMKYLSLGFVLQQRIIRRSKIRRQVKLFENFWFGLDEAIYSRANICGLGHAYTAMEPC